MSRNRVEQVADQVWIVAGTAVNWVILGEGSDRTLIDSGYAGDIDRLEASIRYTGARPEDVRAVLLTHAHIDHVGGAAALATRYDTPIYLDSAEVPHARREYREQVSPMTLLTNLWRPGVAPWLVQIVRAGAARDIALPDASAFSSPGPLDLPGRPVPLPSHGHTAGHSGYLIPSAGAVASGDALITAHEVSTHDGPQLTPSYFSHNHTDSLAALDAFTGLDADLLLPGHGPARRGSVDDAVAAAREYETR